MFHGHAVRPSHNVCLRRRHGGDQWFGDREASSAFSAGALYPPRPIVGRCDVDADVDVGGGEGAQVHDAKTAMVVEVVAGVGDVEQRINVEKGSIYTR